jgi:hypothetical protein
VADGSPGDGTVNASWAAGAVLLVLLTAGVALTRRRPARP